MKINFLKICQQYALDPHYVQGAGGNVSFKENSKMYIKASGVHLKNILTQKAISEVQWKDIKKYHETPDSRTDSESVYLSKIRSCKSVDSNNPSMEAGFHALLSRYVIHFHPTIVNVFLCSKEGEKVLSEILSFSYQILPYFSPGQALTAAIHDLLLKDPNKTTDSVFLLKNHGVIIASDNYKSLFSIQEKLISSCRKYIFSKLKNTISFESLIFDDKYKIDGFLFPDQIVFNTNDNLSNPAFQENTSAAIWIDRTIKLLGWNPNYLSQNEIAYISNMQSETERRKLNSIK